MKYILIIILFTSLVYSSCKSINISAKDITTLEILQRVAKICDLSLFIQDKNTSTKLSHKHKIIILKKFSLMQLLDTLLEDIYYKLNNKTLSLSFIETKVFKLDYITSRRQGKSSISAIVQKDTIQEDENSIVSIEVFDLWKSIKLDLQKLLNIDNENKSLIINKNAGIVIVKTNKQKQKIVSEYLKLQKKRLSKQVLLSLNIISVRLNNKHQSGIDWSKFSLSFDSLNHDTISATGGNPLKLIWDNTTSLISKVSFSMQGMVDFLQTQGHTKVVSTPKILTLNNQQALITIGDNINYQVIKSTKTNQLIYEDKTLFIGILLNLVAQISENNEITLRINPSISRFKYQDDDVKQTTPRNLPPDTTQKKLSAVVKLQNNQTLVLGGLMTKGKSIDKSGVPLLKNIPFLGKFFRSEREIEHTDDLIFVLNAKIIED